MPPKDDKKKKDAGKSAKKDKDPVNKSGGKAKKKWSKDRVWDQLNNLDLFDKLCKEVSNQKLTASLSSLRDWRFVVPWPEQPFRNSLVKDLLNWFQSTELKWFTPETPRVEMPQLLVKMHEQVPPTVDFEK